VGFGYRVWVWNPHTIHWKSLLRRVPNLVHKDHQFWFWLVKTGSKLGLIFITGTVIETGIFLVFLQKNECETRTRITRTGTGSYLPIPVLISKNGTNTDFQKWNQYLAFTRSGPRITFWILFTMYKCNQNWSWKNTNQWNLANHK
jgi:hypothetical protein